MIRPIGQSQRKPKIGMSRGEVSPQESRRSSVHKLDRKAVRDPAGGHPNGLARRKRRSVRLPILPRRCSVIRNSGKRELSRLGHCWRNAYCVARPRPIRTTSGPASRTMRMSVAGETPSRSRRSAAWRTPRPSSADTLDMKRLYERGYEEQTIIGIFEMRCLVSKRLVKRFGKDRQEAADQEAVIAATAADGKWPGARRPVRKTAGRSWETRRGRGFRRGRQAIPIRLNPGPNVGDDLLCSALPGPRVRVLAGHRPLVYRLRER